jgi:hypothetical protein
MAERGVAGIGGDDLGRQRQQLMVFWGHGACGGDRGNTSTPVSVHLRPDEGNAFAREVSHSTAQSAKDEQVAARQIVFERLLDMQGEAEMPCLMPAWLAAIRSRRDGSQENCQGPCCRRERNL